MATIVEGILQKAISEDEDTATLNIAGLHIFPGLLALHDVFDDGGHGRLPSVVSLVHWLAELAQQVCIVHSSWLNCGWKNRKRPSAFASRPGRFSAGRRLQKLSSAPRALARLQFYKIKKLSPGYLVRFISFLVLQVCTVHHYAHVLPRIVIYCNIPLNS